MPEQTSERIADIIAAAVAEGAHAPAEIPVFISKNDTPATDAVKALKASKPHLFRVPDATKMTREEYQAAKTAAFRAIAAGR